jgi:hypothetical protein
MATREEQNTREVKRIRVFIGNTVWDERKRKYRRASWGDPIPMPRLFNQMIAPHFDDSGYVGGPYPRSWRTNANEEREYVDAHFVVMLSHFIPREAAKEVCEFAFGLGWDKVNLLYWSQRAGWARAGGRQHRHWG